MTNSEKAVLSLIGLGVLGGTFKVSARRAGWSAAAIGGAIFLVLNPDKIRRMLP